MVEVVGGEGIGTSWTGSGSVCGSAKSSSSESSKRDGLGTGRRLGVSAKVRTQERHEVI